MGERKAKIKQQSRSVAIPFGHGLYKLYLQTITNKPFVISKLTMNASS